MRCHEVDYEIFGGEELFPAALKGKGSILGRLGNLFES